MKIRDTEAKVPSAEILTRPNDIAYKPQFSTSTSLILDRMHTPVPLPETPLRQNADARHHGQVSSSVEVASAPAQSAESGQKRKRTGEEEPGQVPSPAGDRGRETPSPLAEITVGSVAAYNPEAVNAVEQVRSRLQNNIQQLAANRSSRVRCEKCTRTLSPMFNQLVLCSRCHAAWHQLCHEPEIDDEVVKLASASWYCARCTAERSRSAGLKRIKFINSGTSDGGSKRLASNLDLKKTLRIEPKVPDPIADSMRVSWKGCSARQVRAYDLEAVLVPDSWLTRRQRRAYFATLSGSELIQLLMRSTDLHPDLPIFPPSIAREPTDATPGTQVPSRAGGLPRTGTYRNGIINSIRKSSSSAKIRLAALAEKDNKDNKGGTSTIKTASAQKSASPSKAVLGTQIDPDEEDPTGLMDAWPQPGQGLYATLTPEWEDDSLVDHGDSGAFSHTLYGPHGHKIRDNSIMLRAQ